MFKFFNKISNKLKPGSKSTEFLDKIDVIITSILSSNDINKIKNLLETFKIKKEGFTDLIERANIIIQKINSISLQIQIQKLNLTNEVKNIILSREELRGKNNRNIKSKAIKFYISFLDDVIKIYTNLRNNSKNNSNKQIYKDQLKIINEVVHPLIRKIHERYLDSSNPDIKEKFNKIKALEK